MDIDPSLFLYMLPNHFYVAACLEGSWNNVVGMSFRNLTRMTELTGAV